MDIMKWTALAVLLGTAAVPQSVAAQAQAIKTRHDAATDLHFLNEIMATKADDKKLYILLGNGFLGPFSFGKPADFVSKWLKDHPDSVVIPVSRMLSTNTITHMQLEIIYIWIEDGTTNLNVDLVRNGIFIAGTMYDMVDNEKGLDELLKRDPTLADARDDIAKERAARPQDRTERLVLQDDYDAHLARFNEAERYARSRKLGVWSDSMKNEREAEGIQ